MERLEALLSRNEEDALSEDDDDGVNAKGKVYVDDDGRDGEAQNGGE